MQGRPSVESIIGECWNSDHIDLSSLGLVTLTSIIPFLAQMPSLRSLDLTGNEIASLPLELKSLERLEAVILSQNPLTNLENTLRCLSGLQSLKHLWLDVRSKIEEDEVLAHLPRIESFNGVSFHSATRGFPGTNDQSEDRTAADIGASRSDTKWNEEDSEAALHLFLHVTHQKDGSENSNLKREFTEYLERVREHANHLVENETDSFSQQGEVLKAHRLMLEFTLKVFTRQMERNVDDALRSNLVQIFNFLFNLLDKYDAHWRTIVRDREERLLSMKEYMREAIEEIESYVASRRQQEEKSNSTDNTAVTAPATATITPEKKLSKSVARQMSGNAKKEESATSVLSSPRQTSFQQEHRVESPKILNIRQLKVCIEDIYLSKTRYDTKCRENNLPCETMEQFLYTYLNQKYGLKEMVLEWAKAVISGIRRFADHDNDVAVFGKILRNEIDEDFRFVQQKVRGTVRELLFQRLRNQFSLKVDSEINKLVEKKIEKGLKEEEWSYIVKYMYNQDDASRLISIIQRDLYQLRSPRRGKCQGKSEAPLVAYSDFLSLLLNFQLANHEAFLKPIVAAFRGVDTNKDGIINNAEFRVLILELFPDTLESQIKLLLQKIDPLGSQVLTFSGVVPILGSILADFSQ